MDDLERTIEEAAYQSTNTHYPKLIEAFNDFFERGYAPVQVIDYVTTKAPPGLTRTVLGNAIIHAYKLRQPSARKTKQAES
jgi:hypothetical protein